jgi:uncharacterized protein YdhG (YjbR/CyaY superfamily)
MKKAAKRARGAAAKGTGAPKTVDQYLAQLPAPARSTLSKVRAAIRSVVPPGTTEVISYRIPAFRHHGVLVWFAAFSGHWSFFPTVSVIEMFKVELADYPTSKGTIRFPLDQPPPLGLVKRMVKARVAQHEDKKTR